ncbi:class I SAM-dependent methyltransferase [Streptomyces sp. HNM0574]|uniref:SAM-dependent methyltransferase n=1 Tax=Streptomyces sp. HNM0574 TaxID=2714954 RepID=UPI00146BBA55|nr:class I SAM-dependent methyltransferase [Streptomyces sp. HNM0574]NLU66129.1 class I SAM-dependent methyltransferase [Streptomyces sp. HNM0574]
MDAQTSAGRPALLELSPRPAYGTAVPELGEARQQSAEHGGLTEPPEFPLSPGWLPGLESVAPLSPEDVWLQGALLGPFSADIVAYLGLARATGGPVLDLGSGAGRLTVPFARHGFRVEAVDRDRPSLVQLRAWAARFGPRVHRLVTTTHADLTELRLTGSYRLAVLAGSMVTAIPPEARAHVFREVATHLGDGGALALDYTAHELPGLHDHPRRGRAFHVPRFDGVTERVRSRQEFCTSRMRETVTYDCERSAPGHTHRVRLTTEKWIVDPARLEEDVRAAGLRVASVSRHRIDHRTRGVLLVCAPGA